MQSHGPCLLEFKKALIATQQPGGNHMLLCEAVNHGVAVYQVSLL